MGRTSITAAPSPAVAEDHGLSAAPVLVIDLRAVLGRDRGHGMVSIRAVAECRRRRLGSGGDARCQQHRARSGICDLKIARDLR